MSARFGWTRSVPIGLLLGAVAAPGGGESLSPAYGEGTAGCGPVPIARPSGLCRGPVTIGPAIPAELVRDPGTLDTWIGSRLADCFAWESFAALNWPAGAECRGTPARGPDAASDWISNRVWETYKEPYELFQATDTSWDPADVGFDDAAPTSDCTDITVGLVGLHIARKVASSPKWIWATFEHEDNVPPAGSDGDGRDYNFFSAQCVADPPTDCSQQVAIVDTDDICCPNLITYPSPDPAYSINQVTRLVPIQASPSIDQRFRQAYAAAGSPFQYLTLVGAQWAKPKAVRHGGWGKQRRALPKLGKAGGNPRFHKGGGHRWRPAADHDQAAFQRPCNPNGPWAVAPPKAGEACYEQVPEFLRNTSMETLFVQTDETGTQRVTDSCMNCHFAGGIDGSYLWLGAMLNPYALSSDWRRARPSRTDTNETNFPCTDIGRKRWAPTRGSVPQGSFRIDDDPLRSRRSERCHNMHTIRGGSCRSASPPTHPASSRRRCRCAGP